MKKYILLSAGILVAGQSHCYEMPLINLGASSFLDGGPLRQVPGYYFQVFSENYTAKRYFDGTGQPLCTTDCPYFRSWFTAYELIYLSTRNILGIGNIGWDATLPICFYSKISPNDLELPDIPGLITVTDNGAGFGDLALGVYLQSDPIFHGDRPVYVHRFELTVSIPTGRYNPYIFINSGNGVVFINPYWAATLYFTPTFSLSWRVHYLWVSAEHAIHFQCGDAVHANFTLEYALRPRFYLGISGYFLEQIHNDSYLEVSVPHTKEQVLGLGGGFLYDFSGDLETVAIGNLFFESRVRDRPKGIKFVMRYYSHF